MFYKNSPSIFILSLFFLILPVLSGLGEDIRYARGFEVRHYDSFKVVTVDSSAGEGRGTEFRYVLVPRGSFNDRSVLGKIKKKIPGFRMAELIAIPVENIVSLSTTFLPPFDYFHKLDLIAGVDLLKNIYDPRIKKHLEAEGVFEVGNGPTLNLEKVLSLQPDLVMANLVEGEWNVIPKLERAGISVLVNADYLETSPLGRAEWMKFIALFIDAEGEAEKLFGEIEARYLSLRRRVNESRDTQNRKPTVLFNTPLSGRWVIPGGSGYMATFVRDAGGKYLWDENDDRTSLVRDIETVFAGALDADIWLHQYGWNSLREALLQEPSFARMKAFRTGRIFNNDAKENEYGSNDFYESGPYRPDLILADLVSLFYPELLPGHTLTYYRYLGRK